MSDYTLPDLDWDYGALEPHISGAINELHHDKHHATYVKTVNELVKPPETSKVFAPFACMVPTSALAPGLSRTRSA